MNPTRKQMKDVGLVFKYSLKFDSYVTMKIYDVTGRLVSTIIDENISAGNNQVNFDAKNLASGVYFYNMIATYKDGVTKTFNESSKMVFTK